MRFSKLLIAAVVAVAGIAITAEDASANCYGQQVVIQQRQRLRIRGAVRGLLRHRQQIVAPVVAPVYAQPVVQQVVQQVVQPVAIQAYVAQPVALVQPQQYVAPVVQPQCAALGVCGQQQLQSYQSVLPQCH